MKINNNLIISTKISSFDEKWSIEANLNAEGYYMPSLYGDPSKINFDADNSKWIIEKLLFNLKILLTYREAINLTSDVIHEAITFEIEELNEISKEDYQIIVDIIEQAIELGFFKEYYDKSK